MTVTVYYEDQRGVAAKGYGPHALLLACLVDLDPTRDRWALHRMVVANPRKGDAKLLAALRDDAPIARVAGGVAALLDHDRIRRTLALPGDACKSEVLACLARDHGAGPREVVLLEENTETLLDAVCRVLVRPPLAKKPSPDERDALLNAVAFHADPTTRARLLAEVPSFDRLVRYVAAALG